MSTPNKSGSPSKRARNDGTGSQTPNRDPITPSRRTRSGSQQTPSQRTPNRNRKFPFRSFPLHLKYGFQFNDQKLSIKINRDSTTRF